MGERVWAGSVLLVALGSLGCGSATPPPVACAAYAVAGLNVSVSNAATGQPICDAAVTATDGAHQEQLVAVGCAFAGAYERPGVYVVRAEREGFTPAVSAPARVVMGRGECPHVEPVQLRLALAPAD